VEGVLSIDRHVQGRPLADLLSIGPRAKGPALCLLIYTNLHFLLKLLMYSNAGAGLTVFFKRGMRCNENQSELHGFNTLFHQNSFWHRTSGHCFDNVWTSFSIAAS